MSPRFLDRIFRRTATVHVSPNTPMGDALLEFIGADAWRSAREQCDDDLRSLKNLLQHYMYAWNIELLDTAKRQLRKIDRHWQSAILDYLEDEIAVLDDPRTRGKVLHGDKQGIWRYRVGNYRILCEIVDDRLVIAVITLALEAGFGQK